MITLHRPAVPLFPHLRLARSPSFPSALHQCRLLWGITPPDACITVVLGLPTPGNLALTRHSPYVPLIACRYHHTSHTSIGVPQHPYPRAVRDFRPPYQTPPPPLDAAGSPPVHQPLIDPSLPWTSQPQGKAGSGGPEQLCFKRLVFVPGVPADNLHFPTDEGVGLRNDEKGDGTEYCQRRVYRGFDLRVRAGCP